MILTNIMPWLLIQLRFKPQNDRLNLSFSKDFSVVDEQRPERVVKWPFLSRKFPGLFLQNCKKGK